MFSPSRSRNTHVGAQPNDTKHKHTHTHTHSRNQRNKHTRFNISLFFFFIFLFSFLVQSYLQVYHRVRQSGESDNSFVESVKSNEN
jgi:hypothetical protein